VAIYGLHGEWEVENRGIAPDIEVENDPASVAAGHDAQLEKAVEVTGGAQEASGRRSGPSSVSELSSETAVASASPAPHRGLSRSAPPPQQAPALCYFHLIHAGTS